MSKIGVMARQIYLALRAGKRDRNNAIRPAFCPCDVLCLKGAVMSVFSFVYDTLVRNPPPEAALGDGTYKENEAATYRVERRIEEAEVRAYDPMIRAEVTVDGDPSQARSAGFRKLAGFIFGKNTAQTEVAMTVPVMQVPQPGDRWTVSFMMPSAYTLDTLPQPKDPDIRFHQTPARRMLCLSVKGRGTDARMDAAHERLLRIAQDAGIDAAGEVQFNFYDAPMTPFWKRTNDVALPIA